MLGLVLHLLGHGPAEPLPVVTFPPEFLPTLPCPEPALVDPDSCLSAESLNPLKGVSDPPLALLNSSAHSPTRSSPLDSLLIDSSIFFIIPGGSSPRPDISNRRWTFRTSMATSSEASDRSWAARPIGVCDWPFRPFLAGMARCSAGADECSPNISRGIEHERSSLDAELEFCLLS